MSADRQGMRAPFFATAAAVLTAAVIGSGLAATPGAYADTVTSPLVGKTLYVNPNATYDAGFYNQAAAQAKSNPTPSNTFVASIPQAVWLTPDVPTKNMQAAMKKYMAQAAAAKAYPTFVLYAIPGRDCGNYSAGGFSNTQQYAAWVDQVAAGLGTGEATFIVEPDALMLPPAVIDGQHYGYCDMTDAQISERFTELKYAVDALTAHAGANVYLDGGNSSWWYGGDLATMVGDYHGSWFPQEVANRLKRAGVDKARGFAVNVSGFLDTASQEAYAERVSAKLDGKHYVVDTSRNGNGTPTSWDWCNPPGGALGALPTTTTAGAHADAYLWIKHPGESDGTCNGGPTSGYWFQSYVDGLYAHASLSVRAGMSAAAVTTPAPTVTTPAPTVTTPAPTATTPAPAPTTAPTSVPVPVNHTAGSPTTQATSDDDSSDDSSADDSSDDDSADDSTSDDSTSDDAADAAYQAQLDAAWQQVVTYQKKVASAKSQVAKAKSRAKIRRSRSNLRKLAAAKRTLNVNRKLYAKALAYYDSL